jgi:hypothetical protein
LIAAFGAKSTLAVNAVSAIGAALKSSLDRKSSGTATWLFEAWRGQFGLDSIADRRASIRRERITAWRRKWLDASNDFDEDLFLFSVQTYSAVVLKLLAARLSFAPSDKVANEDFWRSIESGERLRERESTTSPTGTSSNPSFMRTRKACFDPSHLSSMRRRRFQSALRRPTRRLGRFIKIFFLAT